MTVGQVAGHGIPGDDGDPVGETGLHHPPAGDLGRDGEVQDRGAKMGMAPDGGDRPRAGTASHVEQPLMGGEVDDLGQRLRGTGEDCVDPAETISWLAWSSSNTSREGSVLGL